MIPDRAMMVEAAREIPPNCIDKDGTYSDFDL
jgi:hypothetical protein